MQQKIVFRAYCRDLAAALELLLKDGWLVSSIAGSADDSSNSGAGWIAVMCKETP
jgi:hypothetical protein